MSLLETVDVAKLPAIYGGACACQAQCIYSDKGPWSVVLNVVDFQNKQLTTTEVEFQENTAAREEFKFRDDSDDENVDLDQEVCDIAKLKAAFQKRKFSYNAVNIELSIDLPPESQQMN